MPGRRQSSMHGPELLAATQGGHQGRAGEHREFADEEATHPFQAPMKHYVRTHT